MSFGDMLGRKWRCEFCGRDHFIPTKWVDLETGALERLGDILSREGWRGKLLLVADETTYEVAGRKTAKILKDSGFEIDKLIFPSPSQATQELGLQVRKAVETECSAVVAVGSGTVNDLAKWGSYQAGKPYIVVPTAASMNGYTSSIAALSVRGVKRTIPAHPPVGVVTEPEIVASAPVRMSSSGYADLQSKSVADIDWRLSHLIFGRYYCPLPRKGVAFAERRLMGQLDGIARGVPESISALLEALVESGISMVVAGSSSPASGGEHLISHWLDMQAHRSGRTPAMHGEQVGIGTLVAAEIYRIWLETNPEEWRSNPCESRPPEERIAEFKRRYGEIAEEVMEEFRKKWLSLEEKDRILNEMRRRWDKLREAILEDWIPPQKLRENLRIAGAPISPDQIGISEDEFRQAVLHAREIRRRWTSLDFAYLVGILPDRIDEILTSIDAQV